MKIITDEIVSIDTAGIEQTFDVSVVDNHNFLLSNEILSHNSGKTTGAISTHKYIATKTLVPFTVDDVLPNEQYYPDAVKYAKPHQSIIIDEQKEQQTGLGSFRIMQHTEDLNNIVAKLCLNISWVLI